MNEENDLLFFPRKCFPLLANYLEIRDLWILNNCFPNPTEDCVCSEYHLIVRPDPIKKFGPGGLSCLIDYGYLEHDESYGYIPHLEEEIIGFVSSPSNEEYQVYRRRSESREDDEKISFCGILNWKLSFRGVDDEFQSVCNEEEFSWMQILIEENRKHTETFAINSESLPDEKVSVPRNFLWAMILRNLKYLHLECPEDLPNVDLLYCPMLEKVN